MIVFIDQSGQPGGAELCLADISSHYRDQCRVILLADGPFAEALRNRGVPVMVLPAGSSLASVTKKPGPAALIKAAAALPGYLSALRKQIHDSDLLYLNTPKALILGITAASGKPAIYHLHDLLESGHFSRMNIRLIIAAANRCRAVIANSRATAEAFREAGGRTPVHVIPNGFDALPFESVGDAEVSALRDHPTCRGRRVATVFGRIARWKGQRTLLDAAREIPELAVWIVGDAFYTDDDFAYREELRAVAGLPELRDRVWFAGSRGDVPALMKASDIVVHTSTHREPFGRVVVEGLLAERPVIASNQGGPAEILSSGNTGWLVPPGDPALLTSTIRELLTSPESTARIAAAGAADARAKYSLQSVLSLTDGVVLPLLRP